MEREREDARDPAGQAGREQARLRERARCEALGACRQQWLLQTRKAVAAREAAEAAAVAAAREAEEAEASLAKLEAIDPRVTEAVERGTEIGGSSSATTWTWHEGWAPRQEWSWHEGWAPRELGWWADDWSEGWASHERSSRDGPMVGLVNNGYGGLVAPGHW